MHRAEAVLEKPVKYFRGEWTHYSHTGTIKKFVLRRCSFLVTGMLCGQQKSLNMTKQRQIILCLSHLQFRRYSLHGGQGSKEWLRKLL